MQLVEDISIQCPFCFESFFVRVDRSEGESQEFIYDCEICCKPIQMTVNVQSGAEITIESNRDD